LRFAIFRLKTYFAPVSDVTRILDRVQAGDPKAAEELLPLVYEELRKLAMAKMAHHAGQTLQATALVHEAYQAHGRVRDHGGSLHFFRAAAEAMRCILIENACRKAAGNAAGCNERIQVGVGRLHPADTLSGQRDLEYFATDDAPKAELVRLRFLSG
jgi:RNA polymerase sigma factor (TIGR02999 family)